MHATPTPDERRPWNKPPSRPPPVQRRDYPPTTGEFSSRNDVHRFLPTLSRAPPLARPPFHGIRVVAGRASAAEGGTQRNY